MKKENLTVENLNASYYDGGDETYDLEFLKDGKQIFVRVAARNYPGAMTDEDFWNEEENIKKAVEEAFYYGNIEER